MQFVFGGTSGTAFGNNDNLVQWSGGFPGGGPGTSHVTNADHTLLNVKLPLFVGRESEMRASECREECVGLPAARESECTTSCNANQSLGRYNDKIEIGFSGMESDGSPSKAWGVVAGIAAGALTCAAAIKLGHPVAGCEAAVGVGGYVAGAVNNALSDDDDHLGAVSPITNASPNDWNLGSQQTSKLGGPDRTGGDIDLHYHNQRVGSPRILSYAVRVKSIKVTDDYEESDCSGPADVFLNARAHLHQGQSQMIGSTRLPASGNWQIAQGATKTFSPPLQIGGQTFSSDNAPESPFLYVEIGVWEEDQDPDLMGILADTLMLTDVLGGQYQASEETTSEGGFVRRVKFDRTAVVHGYAGSDNHCWPWWKAHGWNPQAEEGGAIVTYEIELTWLKAPTR